MRAADAKRFEDMPNIGKAVARDFARLGLHAPKDLAGKDAKKLYDKMCRLSGTRQDPCVLDTYMAAIDFMGGAKAKPWWAYTAARKRDFPDL